MRLSHSLFSSHDVDEGSRLLLDSLAGLEELRRPGLSALDLGCGVGVLGLSLQRANPSARVLLTDRDALALAFTAMNAGLNGLDAAVEGRLGVDPAEEGPRDLVVSNLPAKAGAPVLGAMVRDSLLCLPPRGLFAFVIVRTLEDAARGLLRAAGASIGAERRGREHVVFHVRPGPAQPPPARGEDPLAPYLRGRFEFELEGSGYSLETAWNLPDFDTPGYDLRLAARFLEEALEDGSPPGPALVWNPGQGHLPVLLAARDPGRELTLASRDLLQLRIADRNLRARGAAGARLLHRPLLSVLEAPQDGPFALIAAFPDVEPGVPWEAAVLPACARLCAAGGRVVLAASSTAVQRMLHPARGFRLLRSRKGRGGRRGVLLEKLP